MKTSKRKTKAERVRAIVDLMLRMQWGPTSLEKLQAKWGTGYSTLERDAAEASRRIRDGINLSPEALHMLIASVHQVASDAARIMKKHEDINPQVAVNALRVKLEAVKVLVGSTRTHVESEEEEPLYSRLQQALEQARERHNATH